MLKTPNDKYTPFGDFLLANGYAKTTTTLYLSVLRHQDPNEQMAPSRQRLLNSAMTAWQWYLNSVPPAVDQLPAEVQLALRVIENYNQTAKHKISVEA